MNNLSIYHVDHRSTETYIIVSIGKSYHCTVMDVPRGYRCVTRDEDGDELFDTSRRKPKRKLTKREWNRLMDFVGEYLDSGRVDYE